MDPSTQSGGVGSPEPETQPRVVADGQGARRQALRAASTAWASASRYGSGHRMGNERRNHQRRGDEHGDNTTRRATSRAAEHGQHGDGHDQVGDVRTPERVLEGEHHEHGHEPRAEHRAAGELAVGPAERGPGRVCGQGEQQVPRPTTATASTRASLVAKVEATLPRLASGVRSPATSRW